MTPVPWVTTPPDRIEQIVAVLLGNRHERSFRIRPSKGDGGLDVLVPTTEPGHFDDYQVKKFATNLGFNEKRHITESLEAAIKTHNDADNPFLIDNWYLTLPLNPTREQYKWLADEVARLKPPFKVEWRALDFLEGLAADYPQVIDYYLYDGKIRLNESIRLLRDLVQLGVSETGAALEPNDAVEKLGDLHLALNREDPHYRYDFEVTGNYPDLTEGPDLVASVVDGLPDRFVTFHIYARYADAGRDRPIPISFKILQAELTTEQLEAFESMTTYGTPVMLPESVITEINVDMPAGLGMVNGTGSITLGPARALNDQPSRVVWAIVPPDSAEPLAQLTFEVEAPTHGMSGGMRVHGIDTTGVVVSTILIDPSEDDKRRVSISVSIINPAGKPVAQVLPGLRFLDQFKSPNRLAFGPEYGLLTVADEVPLSASGPALPTVALEYAESLEAICRRSGKLVVFPNLDDVDMEDCTNIICVGRLLRGQQVPLTWTSITARIRPGTLMADFANKGVLSTTQSLTVMINGESYDLGQFHTYLLSPRVEGDLDAEPDDDGTIPIAIVPDQNNQAVMSSQPLTPDEAHALNLNFQAGSE